MLQASMTGHCTTAVTGHGAGLGRDMLVEPLQSWLKLTRQSTPG
jgi:hypothetical protein